jgi:hypothetical protein
MDLFTQGEPFMIRSSSLHRQSRWAFLLVGLLLFAAKTTLWAQTTPALPAVDRHTDQAYRIFMPVVLALSTQADNLARGKLPPVVANAPTPTPLVTPAPTSPPPSAPPLTTLAPITPTLPLTTAVSLTWEFQFAVANSELAAQWVMKEVADDGTTTIVQRVDLRELCSIHGAVTLTDSQANFTDGYIACNLPNFEAEVQNYLASASECECAFTLQTPPWVAATFEVFGWIASKPPLVAVENGFRYEITHLGSSYHTRWVFDSQNSLDGPPFPLTGQQTTFTGYNPAWVLPTLALDSHNAFLHDVAFTQAAMNTPDYAFLSWLPTQSLVTTPVLDYSVNPSPTTIYIGGEPSSNARFIGTLDKLTLDPGCRGFGSGGGNP